MSSSPLWLRLKQRRLSAEQLLAHFGMDDEPPIDVMRLARRMGVEVGRETDPRYSGRLESADGPEPFAHIFVNTDEPRKRQRFTIAHEFGHLMKHPVGLRWRDTDYRGTKEEREANNFAASLLMPATMVEAYAELTADARELATIFDVGVQSMEYRLLNVLHGIR